jgi:signal transduction histidine kinase
VLIRGEATRRRLEGHIDALAETNDLLTMLNSVARTLPGSLSSRDAIDSAREQIVATFHPTVICLVEYDGVDQSWVPKMAEGCVLSPTSHIDDLPTVLAAVADLDETQVISNLQLASKQGIARGSRSGLYVRLSARGRTVGLLGLEHRLPGHFGSRDALLLDGLADVLALTLDNARSFGRLRSLGGEDERSRIARDLHDRLGQWLTHIGLELERILSGSEDSSVDLTRLYNDVQTALDEHRDNLRQLRSGVSLDRSLAQVGRDLTERFIERTDIDATWNATDPTAALPVPIENELLRILQESLANTERHSRATRVQATWAVSDGAGTLTIDDNGVGFDADRGVRDSAYGLVGMRERADAIGAHLSIESSSQAGTTIVVSVDAPPKRQET